MKDPIIAGTTNPGKFREIQAILQGAGLTVLSLDRFPQAPAVEETGETFRENARIKAVTLAEALQAVVLGEDSGLEVDALHGAPGVRSARFAQEVQNTEANNALLLERLKGIPAEDRGARYRCAVCLAGPGKILAESEATTEGRIVEAPRGTGGFGYDPLFLSADLGMTFGEADPSAKHAVSHRGRALHALLARLKEMGFGSV
ncbi:MAG: RdgB/HAM1 family non-canonical purine NTP pyrophosphatase [Planctomycetota bacterium]|jgi:XTP/dITP diphosphohydrolase